MPRPDRTRTIGSVLFAPRCGKNRALVLVALGQLLWVACAIPGSKATDIVIAHQVTGEAFVVDRDAVFQFSLSDVAGNRIVGASLTVEANMTHPGMAPIVVQAVHEGEGKYKATLRFTMAGEWALDLKGTLPDRRVLDQPFGGFVTVRPAG